MEILFNKDSKQVVATEIEVADSFWSRFRGLMFRRKFDPGECILFKFPKERKFGIHTFFVFFPIDVIYLNADFEVVEMEEGLSPWSSYSPNENADFLIELPEGVIHESGLEVGDKLAILRKEAESL